MSRPLPPPFAPGDRVRPRAEWAGKLAGGTVARVARWGDTHIVYLVGVGAGAMLASCYEADEGVAA